LQPLVKVIPVKVGNLIRITRRPTDDPGAQETTFWCERAGMSVPLQIGSVGLVVDAHARSAVGNEIIIFMQGEELYSICRWETHYMKGRDIRVKQVWCEVLDRTESDPCST
jgi:hypothetical protein